MVETPTILVVDDEPDLEFLVRQRFRRDIRKGRMQFVFAQDGVQALDALQKHEEIDLIMTDINMPRMDGLTLLDELKQVRPRVRAVVVSAYGDMRNIRTAMNRGAFDFITKPIDFQDLEITLEKSLRHVAMLRDALTQRNRLVALHEELRVARKMQASILPQEFPETEACLTHAVMTPAQDVGGDFYDVFLLPERQVGVVIADVSGKGVPAALFMMVSRTLLKGHAAGGLDPAAVLEQVNNVLCEDNESQMFVTLLYGVVDQDGVFTYANAGHCPPYLMRANEAPRLLPTTAGVALGVMSGLSYSQDRAQLQAGDRLFLYTDGVPEAERPDDSLFEDERLRETLAGIETTNPTEVNDAVVQAVREFTGGEHQSDDITCLTLSWRGRA